MWLQIEHLNHEANSAIGMKNTCVCVGELNTHLSSHFQVLILQNPHRLKWY
jgi:hypothetical protein